MRVCFQQDVGLDFLRPGKVALAGGFFEIGFSDVGKAGRATEQGGAFLAQAEATMSF